MDNIYSGLYCVPNTGLSTLLHALAHLIFIKTATEGAEAQTDEVIGTVYLFSQAIAEAGQTTLVSFLRQKTEA